jgi:hypothetical protein
MKRLARILSIKFLMNLLAWKIDEFHSLRESHIKDCDLCNSYFSLCENIDRFKTKYKKL